MKKFYINKYFILNIFVFAFLFQIFISLSISNYINFYNQHSDSAFFVDLLFNIAIKNSIYSEIYSSSYYVYPLLEKTQEYYCNLSNISIDTENLNIFKQGHLYLVSFLLSVPIKLGIDSLMFSSIFFSLNYIFILISIFVYLKHSNIQIPFIFLSTLIIVFWLPFSISWLSQFYFDKLFILPMVLIIFQLEKLRKKNISKIIFFSLLIYIILIHERAALILGAYLISFSFLFRKDINKNFFFVFTSGIFSLAYFLFYILIFQEAVHDISKAYSLKEIVLYLTDVINNTHQSGIRMIKFLILVLPFLLLSIFNFKYFVIGLGSILPNIFITIGGAEKIGLSTHYHVYYLPILICVAVFGCITVFKKNNLFKKGLFSIYLICMLFFNLFFDYTNLEKILSFTKYSPGLNSYVSNNFLPLNYGNLKFKYDNFLRKKEFLGLIPDDASVSVHENNHTFFSKKNNKIDYFPIGIGKSDFLLVDYSGKEKTTMVIPSFLNQDEKQKIIKCLKKLIKNKYEMINNFNYWHGGSLYLYKLK